VGSGSEDAIEVPEEEAFGASTARPRRTKGDSRGIEIKVSENIQHCAARVGNR
jgi:hypothetical protein